MTKLSNRKIRWIVRNVSTGKAAASEAAAIYRITPRRVRQLARVYRMTGTVPMLKANRRPRTSLTDEQRQQIDEAWKDSRLGARLLYWELRRRGQRVPKNKLHHYLKETGRSVPNPRKQKQRKRCRYERTHSLSLLHADWKEHEGIQLIAYEDDASRRILAIGEFASATTRNAISVLKEAEAKAAEVSGFIRQLNTDRGTQFFDNKVDKRGRKRTGVFEKYLASKGIVHVPSRVKNPQTNGKIERWFQEYMRHRHRFKTAEEFAEWYNNRLHGALRLEYGETPNEAFQRKLQPGCLVGLFCRLTGG